MYGYGYQYSSILKSGGGFDADAQAFFDRVTTAGGTLSATEQNAVNTLVVQMKADGIWDSMKAIYPMVGASAAACSQNLKSSSFTGSFSSGWTFASTGVTPNGTSAYMNTNYIPSVNSNLNSAHLSAYIRTTNVVNQAYLGVGISGRLLYVINFGFAAIHNGDTAAVSNKGGVGLFLNNRIISNQIQQYKNTTILSSPVVSSLGLPTIPLYLGGFNSNGALFLPSDNQNAFASIGDGLGVVQEGNFYTAVQAFQTTLSRQV